MKIGLIVTGVFNPAVFFSVSRAVAALALLYVVPQEEWYWAFGLFGWAVFTDVFDGGFAETSPHSWNGKQMNDIPSGILAFATPGSLLLWLFMSHPDAGSVWHSSWFWSWIAATLVYGLGTIVFNSLKSGKRLVGKTGAAHQRVLDSMVRAEVLQAWFHGLFLFAFGAQFWYLVLVERFDTGGDVASWFGYCALAFGMIMYAKDRWSDRPETRAKYAASE